jgi:hypothetical protein
MKWHDWYKFPVAGVTARVLSAVLAHNGVSPWWEGYAYGCAFIGILWLFNLAEIDRAHHQELNRMHDILANTLAQLDAIVDRLKKHPPEP